MIINESWDLVLSDVINSEDFKTLMNRVDNEYKTKVIYPPYEEIFKVYQLINIEDIKVVIIGQDPYHTAKMANGIAFSVKNGTTKTPPSLRNIFSELERDLSVRNTNTDLSSWVKQGIFLLNTTLTVEEGKPASHSKYGWDLLTTETIRKISEKNDEVVFLLWGKHAQAFEKYINTEKHHVLKTSHPSPLSVNQGFKGCSHFSEIEKILNTKFDFTTY